MKNKEQVIKSENVKDPKTKFIMGFFESMGVKFIDVTPKKRRTRKKK